MAANPVYCGTPTFDQAQVVTAQTDKTGATTTNMVSIAVGVTGGKRLNRVRVTAGGTIAAGCVVFFISTDNGTTRRPLCELVQTAVTSSTTAKAYNDVAPELAGLVLKDTNHVLYATTTITQTLTVSAEGASA